MISDNTIKLLSAEIDDILAVLSNKYQLSPLSISAVVNARLIHANREVGSEDDYFQLLRSIAGKEYESTYTTYSKH